MVADEGKNFHSFRHTVSNYLKQKDVVKEQVGAILEHSDKSMTTGRYGKEYGALVLREVVERLEFVV
jgi:integrase